MILRSLTAFEAQAAAGFFGEPEFDTGEFPRRAADGRGIVSVLELLFDDASEEFLESITRTVRLVRSKGVACSSSPRPAHRPRYRRGRGHGPQRERRPPPRWPRPGCAPPSP
ncbi:helicase HerA-like domain-containing protein [Streptomyces griseoruber]|uniref:helicase HerA-like domain-containing protein n=1 Tax=Streptomyces griseoruber TaxID=1943 RepID=UPI0037A194EB